MKEGRGEMQMCGGELHSSGGFCSRWPAEGVWWEGGWGGGRLEPCETCIRIFRSYSPLSGTLRVRTSHTGSFYFKKNVFRAHLVA